MLRIIKVSSSFGGKIPVGNYANANPNFAAEELFEIDVTTETANEIIEGRQKQLIEICRSNFDKEADRAKIEKIKNDRKDFRWYPCGEKQFPSVTSVINFEETWSIPENELRQYASQSQITHKQVDHYIRTGKWESPENLEGIGTDIFLVKTGSLGLEIGGGNFPAFLEKYPLTEMEAGEPHVSLRFEYGGTPDIQYCLYNGIPTLADIKRTVSKERERQMWLQLAAYSKLDEMKEVKQLMLVPLNNKTKQGFSEPWITDKIDYYFDGFLERRKAFERTYAI